MLRSPQRGDEIVALARADEDGKRYAQEAAVRDRTFDEIIEQARREHNDQVVETNAKLRTYRRTQTLVSLSAGCAGGIIGGFGGFLWSRRNRGRRTAAAAAKSTEELGDKTG